MKNLTISQIAELAGVSKTTVSRVLNNKDDIREETRKHVRDVIREYNYRPNSAARTINNRATKTIGLVIPYEADYVLSNPFYYDVIRGIAVEADSKNYHILLMYSPNGSYLKTVLEKRIDGLLLISLGSQHVDLLEELIKTDIPLVSLSKVPGYATVPTISADDYRGAELAVEYLVSQGHRRIAFLNGPRSLASNRERLKAYNSVLVRNGITFRDELVLEREVSVENGLLAMEELLQIKDLSAVFVSGDLMAIGAIDAVRRNGKRVPEDISVVGYDNIPMSEHLSPALTTIDQFGYKKGRLATRTLISKLEGEEIQIQQYIQPELVVRKSTAMLRGR